MDTDYKLSVPKPCRENWSSMTPNEKGKICNACATTVIDFTKMSSIEIKDFIIKNKHQKIY